MTNTLALIPARAGSKGIEYKNFREFAGGPCLVWLACHAAFDACEQGIHLISDVWVSSDVAPPLPPGAHWLKRPAALAQDDTPMLAVVQHALGQIPGPDDQIIVLLQPTQPFRTPDHIRQAVALLRETQADSVVSVVELPRTHAPEFVLEQRDGRLVRVWPEDCVCWPSADKSLRYLPTRRQDVEPAYIRDGTVYVFWRRTLAKGDIYGLDCRPLIIPPEQSCELDTEADWREVERRWKERNGH